MGLYDFVVAALAAELVGRSWWRGACVAGDGGSGMRRVMPSRDKYSHLK